MSKLQKDVYKRQAQVILPFDEALLSGKTLILAGANFDKDYSEALLKLAEQLKDVYKRQASAIMSFSNFINWLYF